MRYQVKDVDAGGKKRCECVIRGDSGCGDGILTMGLCRLLWNGLMTVHLQALGFFVVFFCS